MLGVKDFVLFQASCQQAMDKTNNYTNMHLSAEFHSYLVFLNIFTNPCRPWWKAGAAAVSDILWSAGG